PDITGMRKGDLIAAIKERQSGGSPAPQLALPDTAPTAPAAASENGAAPAAPATEASAPAEAGTASTDAPSTTPPAEGEGRRQRQRRRTEHSGQNGSVVEPVAAAADTATDAPAEGAADNGKPARVTRRGGDRFDNRAGDNRGADNRGSDNRDSRG